MFKIPESLRSVFFCQNVTVAIAPRSAELPVNSCFGSASNENQHLDEINEHIQTLPEDVGESQCEEQQSDENKFFFLPRDYEMDVKPVKREFAIQPIDGMNFGDNARDVEGPSVDTVDNPLPQDDLYLNDIYDSVECPDGFNVEDYITFFDTDEDNLMIHDSSQMIMGNDGSVSCEPLQSLEVSLSVNSSSKSCFQAPNLN